MHCLYEFFFYSQKLCFYLQEFFFELHSHFFFFFNSKISYFLLRIAPEISLRSKVLEFCVKFSTARSDQWLPFSRWFSWSVWELLTVCTYWEVKAKTDESR